MKSPLKTRTYSGGSDEWHRQLCLVIEKITGNDLVDEIKQRILQPLGLSNNYLEGFQYLPQSRLEKRYHYASLGFIRNAGVAPEFISLASITSHAGTVRNYDRK